MSDTEFKNFAKFVLTNTTTIAQRAAAFLYFRAKFSSKQQTVTDLADDFETAGLGRPQLSKLREILKYDKRTKNVSKDVWIISADKLDEVALDLNLNDYAQPDIKKIQVQKVTKGASTKVFFIDPQRIKELKSLKSKDYDLSRLLKVCQEINDNFLNKNYISVIILVRTTLNHVAPIFGFNNFLEVSNNYKCEKSLKLSLQHLENSSRTIADGYLHIPIRNKEVLPTLTQVNFSQDIDVLLGEIFRKLK